MGLSAAMFLGQHGVRSLLVERLGAVSHFPRAAFFHMRTLELFRSAGIETQVIEGSRQDFVPDGSIVLMDTVSGRKLADIIGDLNAGVDTVSPCRRLFLNQPNLEPILYQRAQQVGAELLRAARSGGRVAGRRRRLDDRASRRDRRRAHAARPISRRRRRGALARARAAGDRTLRPARVLQLDHDLFHGRPVALAGRPADQHRLREEPGHQRVLPDEPRADLGFPGHQHGWRPRGGSGGRRQCRRRHQRGHPDRARAHRRRRARPRGAHRQRLQVAGHGGGGRPVPRRPRVPGRRRRACDAAQRRLRRQHRHPRRAQPGLEAGARAERPGRRRPAALVRSRTTAGVEVHGRTGVHPLCHPQRAVAASGPAHRANRARLRHRDWLRLRVHGRRRRTGRPGRPHRPAHLTRRARHAPAPRLGRTARAARLDARPDGRRSCCWPAPRAPRGATPPGRSPRRRSPPTASATTSSRRRAASPKRLGSRTAAPSWCGPTASWPGEPSTRTALAVRSCARSWAGCCPSARLAAGTASDSPSASRRPWDRGCSPRRSTLAGACPPAASASPAVCTAW